MTWVVQLGTDRLAARGRWTERSEILLPPEQTLPQCTLAVACCGRWVPAPAVASVLVAAALDRTCPVWLVATFHAAWLMVAPRLLRLLPGRQVRYWLVWCPTPRRCGLGGCYMGLGCRRVLRLGRCTGGGSCVNLLRVLRGPGRLRSRPHWGLWNMPTLTAAKRGFRRVGASLALYWTPVAGCAEIQGPMSLSSVHPPSGPVWRSGRGVW
jgi:hypothetical protein